MHIISSLSIFPSISWWAIVKDASLLTFDCAEHFEKMTLRNRYRISGANNVILLSVPLVKGRDQRAIMNEVLIHNSDNWQVRHWRSLVSTYRRTPFWEHYEPLIAPLFDKRFEKLVDFNLEAFATVCRLLGINMAVTLTHSYSSKVENGVVDVRDRKPTAKNFKTTAQMFHGDFPRYYQVFEDRIGFQPDLSILDLLFSEGPATLKWLYSNSAQFAIG